jgi:HEAT repeat protein
MRRSWPLALALALAPACLPACSSPQPGKSTLGRAAAAQAGGEPDGLRATSSGGAQPADSIGYFLNKVDERVRAWSNLKLDARSEADLHTQNLLEQTLQYDTKRRVDELVAQLESGPPRNRAIAAVGLGFSGMPQAQPALLAALTDPDSHVVGNALLGLGVLGAADTPTAEIAYVLRTHRDSWTRNNAAFALQRIATARSADARDPELAASLREALADEMAGVRAQCAATLGALHDTESVRPLSDLLYDGENLVALAAAAALASIGAEVPEQKGPTARALVAAYSRARAERRPSLQRELARLADANLGTDVEPWKEWAFKLP